MQPGLDHPQRFALVNELHARPSPRLTAPCHAVMLAFKEPRDAAGRDRARDRAHLAALLARADLPPPPEGATHLTVRIGEEDLRWESFTEFMTYTAFGPGLSGDDFTSPTAIFPEDWQDSAPGRRLASVVVRVEEMPKDPDAIMAMLRAWFIPDSLTAATAIEGAAVVGTDFPIAVGGQMRLAGLFAPRHRPRSRRPHRPAAARA